MSDSFTTDRGFTEQPPIPPSSPPRDEKPEPPPQTAACDGLLIEASREVVGWKPVSSRKRCRELETALGEVTRSITASVAKVRKNTSEEDMSDEARWLVENTRLLRSAFAETRLALKTCRDLRQVEQEGDPRKAVPRAYAAAGIFLRSTGYSFDDRRFDLFCAAVQEYTPFETRELWALQPMLQFVLVQEIARAAVAVALTSAPLDPAPQNGRHASSSSLSGLIRALRVISETEWKDVVERTSLTERVLREDPGGAYGGMEFESRNQYRDVIQKLARHSRCGELEIAKEAIALSRQAQAEWNSDPHRGEHRSHVGYYLVDRGRPTLERLIKYAPPFSTQIRDGIRSHPDAFYLLGIELLTVAIMAFVLNGLRADIPLVWAFLLLLIPATESAIGAMNQLVSFLLPPRPLPKLDFSCGIPGEFTTMVAVPTLLTGDGQVRQTVRDLELRYLGNKDPNLHFALLTDFPDSSQPPGARGTLVELCSELIEELNSRYRSRGGGGFFLFHRDLIYNPVESTWMGWERKRGKLLDFNNLLRGKFDSFPVKAGDLSVLPAVRYVITLDADTQLPRDCARRLVGTLAHPLNRAVVDPSTNTVVEGYGILQPRVGISVRSANGSRLASIYSGQTGFDIYTRAVSDVYQDLMDEGSFTGKGIYDVDALQRVLSDRFPLNSILSHDLIEGAYARAGLVSDIELIDDYPTHFSAYSRRKHRWVRGDWQIMRWLLPWVPGHSGEAVKNPISVISKWKILDNLRRSLVEPATFVLLLAGWFFLPGSPAHWTVGVLGLLLIPAYLRLILALSNLPRAQSLKGFLSEIAEGFVADQVSVFLLIAFLAHQALVTLDAIVRTVVRLTITRRKLLEWETAAESEAGTKRRTAIDIYLEITPFVSMAIAFLLLATRRSALPVAAPILLLWASSGLLSSWLNRPLRSSGGEITKENKEFVRLMALRTWRFFRSFSNEDTGWLIPDNVQEEPPAVALRISPTNLGLLLNTRIAAYQLGYLSLGEFLRATEGTLARMRQMRRHNGHFFNWYDTASLEPLEPIFVSTVDSGNLACCLWVLKQCCLQLADRVAPPPDLRHGIRDHLLLILELAGATQPGAAGMTALQGLQAAAKDIATADFADIRCHLTDLAALPWEGGKDAGDLQYWIEETKSRISILPEDKQATEPSGAGQYRSRLADLAAECDLLVREMDFSFLYHPQRKVLSIGYHLVSQRLENGSYDLLASEARTAVFIAIAKGDLPQESWFRMGRALTICKGGRTLISWSGTMFEYLMPALWMKSYPRTLLDQSMGSAVHCQQHTARKNVPWGISESACGRRNELGHYLYFAFGLRALAMRPRSYPEVVISPYSSFLALALNASAAVENLRLMSELGWVGRYGFYEAADYSGSKTQEPGDCEVVRSWMAHHQGMILLGACNLLAGSAMQTLFHSEPMVSATERVLQERIPRTIPIEQDEA